MEEITERMDFSPRVDGRHIVNEGLLVYVVPRLAMTEGGNGNEKKKETPEDAEAGLFFFFLIMLSSLITGQGLTAGSGRHDSGHRIGVLDGR